jgi:hypothetical protein
MSAIWSANAQRGGHRAVLNGCDTSELAARGKRAIRSSIEGAHTIDCAVTLVDY